LKVTSDMIINKIAEYGLLLSSDYPTDDNAHCFIVEGMIIFLDHKNDSLSITFQADSKPEDVASNLLILCEVDGIEDISIMESYMYDKDGNFITGEDAHNLVKDSLVAKAFKKVAKQTVYTEILNKVNCFNC
jgi:hypothetical protein